MIFLKKAELTNQIVQELANCIVPKNWEKVVYYTEMCQKENSDLVNKSMGKCWVTPDLIRYKSSTSPSVMDTFKLSDLIDELHQLSKNTNEQWCGLGIRLTRDGKYATKFYYEGTPLFDADYTEIEKRFTEIDIV